MILRQVSYESVAKIENICERKVPRYSCFSADIIFIFLLFQMAKSFRSAQMEIRLFSIISNNNRTAGRNGRIFNRR